MIDPTVPTNFNRTKAELQEWLMFCIVVAGKSSFQQAKKLDQFLNESDCEFISFGAPFEKLARMDITKRLKQYKLGQYSRIYQAFSQIIDLDVETCTIEELEAIPGIGPKTARFFLANCRPDQNFAILDTHLLKWLKAKGYDVPKSTPTKKKYLEIEKVFLEEAKKQNKTAVELDLEIWLSYAKPN